MSELRVDTITDELGTGSPDFPNGITVSNGVFDTSTITNSTIEDGAIIGGTIDGATIGGTTAGAGTFTDLTATNGAGIAALNADNLTSGTVPSARISGNYTGIDRTAAVFSHPTNTGSVTTTHTRAVAVSNNSTASGDRSIVAACEEGESTGIYSAVVASQRSSATANRAIVAASLESVASGTRSAVVASEDSEASGEKSAVIASLDGASSGFLSAVIASSVVEADANRSSIIGSNFCKTSAQRASIIASRRIENNVGLSLALGESTSGDASIANRTIHLFGSTGDIEIEGAVSSPVSDFAEYMANATGAEIEAGTLLTLDNGEVRPADEGEDICGVVSHTAGFIGNDAPFHWQARYLRDEFGRQLFEDIPDPDWEAEVPDPDWDGEGEQPTIPNPEPQGTVTVRKENPDWNPELPQVPRNQRPDEWTPVGLLGQVFVRTGEQVQAGDRITAKGGKGYATSERTGLKVMQVTKDFDGDYGIARCLINVMV